MDHDLLAEPLLTWRAHDGQTHPTTLPGLLSVVASAEIADFPRVRAHQFRPWLMFLSQLAAIALRRAGRDEPTSSESEWQSLLLRLTDGDHAPWCLVVEDLARPAFFQSPVPEGSLAKWNTTRHPDDLDILVTTKAHEVKPSLIAPTDVESWVCSLVTVQTMGGFSGRGIYGIARMNSGFGNRPYVALAADLGIASALRRDVNILLSTWPALIRDQGFAENGASLLWLYDWEGKTSFSRQQLAPHFIEVCRRLRMQNAAVGLRCRRASSSAKRAIPEAKGGDVGDPWIPVKRQAGSAKAGMDQPTVLTVGQRGYDYHLLSELLLIHEEYQPAAASLPRAQDGAELTLSAWALARGQGATEGLHERVIVLSGRVRRRLQEAEGRSQAGRRAKEWIGIADKMRAKVLFPALKKLALGETVVEDRFSARLDNVFFDELFGSLDAPDEEARLAFEQRLRTLAWTELQSAIDRCVVPDAQRLRVVSEAERLFLGCLRKHFPDVVNAAASREGVIA